MKPCSSNRKPLALLAADALNANEQRELHAHLETCEGCREYLQEISNVTQKLRANETHSEIQASEAFHQRVVRALRAEEASAWTALASLRAALLNWRVALPASAVAGLIITALVLFLRPAPIPPQKLARANPPNVEADLDPTICNYQMIANRSLDKFDELLNRQATKNPSPGPIYTASMLSAQDRLD